MACWLVRRLRACGLNVGLKIDCRQPVNFNIAGMTPVIEVGYEKNESTLALINYKRTIAGITFRRSY